MLEETPKHLACYVVIGLLVCVSMVLAVKVTSYEGDLRVIGIQRDFDKGVHEELKVQAENYLKGLQFFQELFRRSQTVTKAGLFKLPVGTLIIPPPTEGKEEDV